MKFISLVFCVCLFFQCCSSSKKNAQPEEQLPLERPTDSIKKIPIRLSGVLFALDATDENEMLTELFQYIAANDSIFLLKNPSEELKLQRTSTDELGFRHLTFRRVHQGIPVHLQQLVFHINKNNELYLVQGDYHPSFDAAAEPGKELENIEEIVADALLLENSKIEEKSLVYIVQDDQPVLCYNIIVTAGLTQSWQVLLDARDGKVISKKSLIQDGGEGK